jgi:UDP:flavonoid glycosyltransferase YjiC (YdhE family)
MRVLITTSPWAGHYFPMVPLGWALQGAGHEVRVLCTPVSAPWVKGSGLTPVPVLSDHDNQMFWSRLWHQQRVLRGVALDTGLPLLHPVTGERMASADEFDWPAYKKEHEDEFSTAWLAKMQRTLIFVKTWEPELIIHDLMSTEGPFSAVFQGVPAVLHLWGPVGTDETDPGLKILPDYSNGILRRLGVRTRGRDMVRYVLDPNPASMSPALSGERIDMRYVPYNGPGESPDWLLEPPTKPRVCVVWGHTLSRFGPDAFLVPEILAGLAGLDIEVVVAINPKDVPFVGELPANARILEQFPINLLLPTCSAVVHHGGAGCVMSAVVAGTPQLAVPFESEQQANGLRVAAAGAGLHLNAKGVDGEAIRQALLRLLDEPAFQENATRLRAEMAARPAPSQVVPRLEELARTGQPPATIDWDSIPWEKYLAEARGAAVAR